jgi:hypothetical protein
MYIYMYIYIMYHASDDLDEDVGDHFAIDNLHKYE